MFMGGVVEFSANKYVEYRHGDCNVVLSVPHGGGKKPEEIPDRDAGALVDGRCVYSHTHNQQKDPQLYPVRFKKDMFTQELAQAVATEFHRVTGRRPHVVVSHLHRSKMDPNCEKEKATFCVPLAEEAWTAFHRFLQQAKAAMCGPGLLLDLHGHTHAEEWVELGYTVTAAQLNAGDFSPEMTSVFNLSQSSQANLKDIKDLISGQQSFGGLLEAEGYKVVPSPSFNSPGEGKYYTGGYITETHGSKNGGVFDAIQVESPSTLRNTDKMIPYSRTLAHVIDRFVKLHYSQTGDQS